MRLRGKTAIVTGAGAGIGRAIAEMFAEEGANVVIAEVDEASGREADRSIADSGGQAIFVRTDIDFHALDKDEETQLDAISP